MSTTPLTDAEIAELRELHEKATMAPWSPDGAFLFLCLGDEAVRDVYQGDEEKQNEALACAARNALPALLDEVTRSRARVAKPLHGEARSRTCADADAELDRLSRWISAARALLKRIEWKGSAYPDASDMSACPACDGEQGHEPGCELAALIGGK